MKLFAEQPVVCKAEILEESLDEAGQPKEPEYFLQGIFMQANIENRNGRIYPIDIMKKEVARYNREYVQTNRAFGELEHPANSPSINLDRVSHVITKIWQDGDYFKARAKILDTPCGRIVKAMIKEGCQLGVSSRALGSVTVRNGVSYVNDDFHIITAGDIVFEPSAQAAFPLGIINEDVEWELDPATGEYVQKKPEQTCDCKDDQQVVSLSHENEPDGLDVLANPDDQVVGREILLGQLQDAQQTIERQKAEIVELKNQLSGIKQLQEFDKLLKNVQ